MSYLSTGEVATKIRQAIDQRTPFSLVRLGDGEARLVGYPEYIPWSELRRSLRYWYGQYEPTESEAMELRAALITAAQNADVLGLPSAEQCQKNDRYKMVRFLAAAYELATADMTHCGVHRHLHEGGLLDGLLRGLEHVTVIGCRDVTKALQKHYNIVTVDWIRVPPEAQMQTPGTRHFPDRHKEVLREIEGKPGGVFIVGAGPNGKVYCDAVKRDGGIGLDFGSLLDGWAGVTSRSYIALDPEKYRL